MNTHNIGVLERIQPISVWLEDQFEKEDLVMKKSNVEMNSNIIFNLLDFTKTIVGNVLVWDA